MTRSGSGSHAAVHDHYNLIVNMALSSLSQTEVEEEGEMMTKFDTILAQKKGGG